MSSTAIQARPAKVRAIHSPCPSASGPSGGSHSASVPQRLAGRVIAEELFDVGARE